MRQGRYGQAVAHYERALKARPNDSEAIAGIARALERSGERRRAREILMSALDAGIDDDQLGAILARIAFHDGNYEEAVSVASGRLARLSTHC